MMKTSPPKGQKLMFFTVLIITRVRGKLWYIFALLTNVLITLTL